MSKLAGILLNLSQNLAASRGKVMRVTLDRDRLHFDYVSPTDREGQVHEDHYTNAVLYYKGYGEPIEITETDAEKLDMRTTDYVKHYQEQRVFRDATSATSDDFDLHAKLLVGVIVAILILTVVVVAVLA